ncbi:MAG: PrgI family protein [Lachnospiraceae bacterium]
MEVKINREIRNYKEAVFWGMTLYQFIFAVLACAVAVTVYFLFRSHMGMEILSWLCMAAAAPFVVFGFVRVNDMSLWDFLNVWLDYMFFTPDQLTARPSVVLNQNEANRRL